MGGGMNELGNKIKLWRNYRHLTLEQLNALTGIHYARLSKFERGVEIPNQQMLERIEIAPVSYTHLISNQLQLLTGEHLIFN